MNTDGLAQSMTPVIQAGFTSQGRGAITHVAAGSVPGNRGRDFFLPLGSRAPPVTWEASQLPTTLGEHSKWDSGGGDTNCAPQGDSI